ncbi:hypothetical protein Dvina_02620 [Dactylosporangium vinaceum]|uniref:Uncharacterized protein n=1 Tax=Dactylosporangium vinaceum TaxID=53362 RepID=A0ABV5MER1_9ACTN|nr:hypothetical protein [Dactylosporangium vinaceum]UAB97120.1 hypothetical protein Dvina_02620 [Dactylosporangium vinaceum]
MALETPTTLAQSHVDLPWTLDGGRGIFGLDPISGAIVLWLGLMVLIVLFVLLAAFLSRWSLYRLNRDDRRAAVEQAEASLSPAERARLRTEAGELIRQAAATAAAAKRAQIEVAEAQARSAAAQIAREHAWSTFDVAQKAYQEALRAAGQVAEAQQPAAEPGDDAKRDVSRAALDAFKRGDITVDALEQVFKAAAGADPLQELAAREVELRRTAESRARRLYEAAAATERAAVKAADVAVVAAAALAHEAAEVAQEAAELRDTLDAARQAGIAASTLLPKSRVPRQRTRNSRSTLAADKALSTADTVALPADAA